MIRGQKVMLDSGLADLYEVPTKRLNEAVKRNATRFFEDFMFQLTEDEAKRGPRRPAVSALRLYRARPGDAFVGAPQRASGADEHPPRIGFITGD